MAKLDPRAKLSISQQEHLGSAAIKRNAIYGQSVLIESTSAGGVSL